MLLLSLALAAALSAADIEQISKYDADWANPRPEAVEEARAAFSGRALEIAEQFLHHSDVPPNNGAYAFVLSALGDVEATRALILAIPDPPRVESGILDRHFGEVTFLVEAILEKTEIGGDERIVSAAVDAVARARVSPDPAHVTAESIALLGKCRGPAALRALESLAADSDGAVRSAAAAALGWLKADRGSERPGSPVESLARVLGSDPDAEARLRAAESLGRLGLAEGVDPLQTSLAREEDAHVLDAVVFSLERLGAPVTDPERCRKIAERCWEAGTVRPLFTRWKAAADRRALLAAATDAAPPFRALALQALASTRSGGAALPELDPESAARLADSAIDLLGQKVSLSTYEATLDAFWALAGRRISTALARADRIADWNARYWASAFLRIKDRAGYDSYRRIREVRAAGFLAALFFLLLWRLPAWRRSAAIAITATLGWGAVSFSAESSITLPPWPLTFSTVRFLVFAAAGIASAAAIHLPRMRSLAAGAAAGILFLAAYLTTRAVGFFPPDTQSGYAFLFEPVIGLAIATPLAFLLTLAASQLPRLGRSLVDIFRKGGSNA